MQRFRPKSPPYTGPEAFEPYAVGYVELPETVIVETRLVNIDFDKLKIGMEVEMCLLPFGVDAQEQPVMTYAFGPVTGGDA
ncbi:MAG: OB-fold domain-containing protein [Emcibacter sp.]|nr:OB-fold domain-containing protein [Emcibacter sp.]